MQFNLLESLAHLFHPRRSNRHRSGILHPQSLAVLTLLIIVIVGGLRVAESKLGLIWFGPDSRILGYASNITLSQILSQTNQLRTEYGLPILTLNSKLSQAAEGKARDMFANQYWSHTSPSGTEPWEFIKSAGYVYRFAGENLARDFSVTGDMIQAWMNSPTHRANILHHQYQEIGLAVVNGTLQGIETTLVVQMFGSPTLTVANIQGQAVAVNLPSQVTPLPTQVVNAVNQELPNPDKVSIQPKVLAEVVVPAGKVTAMTFKYQPLDISKSLILSLVILLMLALIYDWYAVGHRQSVRTVGKNLAHLALLGTVLTIIILYKAGQII
ncbi:CAP domain-containing protein [Patescibacteria group bacterium]|nr:CAP domain-containing protein [Patescibacteria group bacterium]